jgi:hypothetical protein
VQFRFGRTALWVATALLCAAMLYLAWRGFIRP